MPFAVLPADVIASNKLQIMPGADLSYFAVLSSSMHMAWMRTVAGRLKSDYSYSPAVYYTFPWPETTPAQKAQLIDLAQRILDVRSEFPTSTLSDLYDPDVMPPKLRKAHQALDSAVDRLYRKHAFKSERERVEHLFGLHEKRAVPLAAKARGQAGRRRAA